METPEESPTLDNPRQLPRAKVYRLNDDGKWDEQGTGHVAIDVSERLDDLGLLVIDEEDNELLLVHRISSDDIYRMHEDTIISWRDADYLCELALSFQGNTECSFIWDTICRMQRHTRSNSSSNEAFLIADKELRELPAVELSALPLILKIVTESSISEQSNVIELILQDECFFLKLMDLHRVSEGVENIDALHLIYKIVREIFEKIFEQELFMDIIGSLEYEPDVPRVHHRMFLKEHVVFKEAIPIKDPLVVSMIHQTYRVAYLKDVILPRVLDDKTATTLSSVIQSNNAAIVSLLKEDNTFIKELFARLKSSTTSSDSKKKLVSFLQEFCILSKSLQIVEQRQLLRDLVSEGIFDIVSDVLQSHDKKLALIGTDILILVLNQDLNLLRSYATRKEGVSLLGLLVKGLITDFGDDMNCQFIEILKSLLDFNTPGGQRDAIIGIFYEKHLDELIDVIESSCLTNGGLQAVTKSASSSGNIASESSAKPEILANICDLMCFCVSNHRSRIKCYFLLNGAVDKVLLLTRRKEKYLVLAAVRFFRTLISSSNECLLNHIVKNNILKPIVDAFVCNGRRYNLLNSAVLELFEFIRKKKLMALLKYLVESFWDQLVKFEYLTSIQSLKVQYEQSLENSGTNNSSPLLDNRSGRLVDYDDDEDVTSNKGEEQRDPRSKRKLLASKEERLLRDNEDHKPPLRKQRVMLDSEKNIRLAFARVRAKRKNLALKEKGLSKKQTLSKKSKSEDVSASQGSVLIQEKPPTEKTSESQDIIPHLADTKKKSGSEDHKDEGSGGNPDNPVSGSNVGSQEGNVEESSRSCLDSTHGI